MMFARTPYLSLRGAIYQVRLPVPLTIQPKLHRKEIRWSLRTRDEKQARLRMAKAVSLFSDLCNNMTMIDSLSKPQSDKLIDAFYQRLNATYAPPPLAMAAYSQSSAQDEAYAADHYATGFAERLSRSELSQYDEDLLNILLSKLGVEVRDLSPQVQAEFLSGASKAYLEHARFVSHTASGSGAPYVPVQDCFSNAVPVQLIATPPLPAHPPQSLEPSDNQIGALIETYIEAGINYGHTSKGPWGATSAALNRKVLRWFEETVGASTIAASITKSQARAFRDALRKVRKGTPANTAFSAALTSNASKAVSSATAANFLSYVKTFFGWLETEGYIDRTPFNKLQIMIPKKQKSEEIRPFTTEEINRLFSSPLYTGYASPHRRAAPGPKTPLRDGYYWLPLILLMTGMRIGEASEIELRNIKLDEDVPHFSILHAKTYAGERKVPLPAALLDFGFAAWIAKMRKKYSPPQPLMSDFRTKMRLKNFTSKKIGTYIDAAVSDDPTLVTHSFRHYFKDRARDAKIPEYIQDQILGHQGQKYIGDHYGSGASLSTLSEEINRIDFGLSDEVLATLQSVK